MATKANVVEATDEKWGKFAGGCLVGEPFVPLFIPKDPLNPKENAKWLGLNGDGCYLAVGKPLNVPKSIAMLWNHSYTQTQIAQESITAETEIQS